MALTPKFSDEAVNIQADALATALDSGILRIYDGSQPATVDTAISTQNVLAELTLGSPAFGSAAAGVITAEAITGDSSADATGTAAWYRAFKSDGTSAMHDGSVGTSGANLNFNSVAFVALAPVNVTSFAITIPKA